MADTIELLEAIGSDASLRYASSAELRAVLEQTNAELAEAMVHGGKTLLSGEPRLQIVQTHTPGHQDDEDDKDDERDVPQPERQKPDQSLRNSP